MSIQVNLRQIAQLPDLKVNDRHPDAGVVTAYLKRFGYMDPDASVDARALEKTTSDALRTLQKQFCLPETGMLDAPTREFMAADRCGLPDPRGPLDFNTMCAWNRRNLTFAFGPLSSQVGNNVAMNAVRRAFNTWANCGVGLTFTEVPLTSTHDFTVEWRQANDPDHNMTGGVLAHADFPPGCSIIVNAPPLPLHYDDQEHTWVDGAVANGFDIETIALHEIGHLLGLAHTNVSGAVMFPTVSANHTNLTLQQDDLDGIRSLYPTLVSPRCPGHTEIGVVSRSADKLDVFVTDNNGVTLTAAWEPGFADWWHGWWELNGGRASPGSPIHAVARSADKLDAFVVGTDQGVYTAAWEPSFADWWHGWWHLNGGVAALGAHVTVVSRNTDKLDAFVVGTDGRVYTAAWEPGFTDWWHGWWPIGNIRVPQGARVHAVSRSADKLDIFVTDVNGIIYTAAWEPSFQDGWHGWWELNGGRAAPGASVIAVSRNTDKLDVFVVGTDGRVYTAAWEPHFTDWWHGWWPIGDLRVPQGAPVHAVSRSADKLDIFVTDVNGVIFTAAWEPSFTDWWHGWWELNGGRAAPGAPVTAVSRSTDKLDVFVVGTDGRVYTAAWEPHFTDWWHGWWPMGV
jgi:hypothetical protein